MTIFETNCLALAKKYPELEHRLRSSISGLVFPKLARSGALTAYKELNEAQGIVWLHSSYDPVREARRIVQASLTSGTEAVAVIGFGLGYAVRELLKEQCRVIVLEPDPALMRSCLELIDVQDVLEHPSLSMLVDPDYETLMRFLQELDPRSLSVLENPAYVNLYPEQCGTYTKVIQKFREKDTINTNTIKRFGRRWVTNIIKNLLELKSFVPMEAYRGCMTGLPVLVLAAGPSLDAVLPFLDVLRARAVLVAVDTACTSLKAAACIPDFVVVADPQFWNARHLDWAVFPEAQLVTEIAVWPSVFHYTWNDTVLASSQYPLGKYIEARLSLQLGVLRAGGSVATSAWDFARQLGASEIYVTGLDLSYPEGKSHARASTFEQYALHTQHRLKPAETAFFTAINNANPYFVNNYCGNKVKTDKRLALYAWWFSRMCALYPSPPTYNLSQSGHLIPEMPFRSIDELAALPPCREVIENRFAALDLPRKKLCGDTVLRTLQSNLDELAQRINRGISAIDLGLAGKQALHDVVQTLDDVEAALLSSTVKDLVGFLLPDITENLGPKPETLEESFIITKKLYQDILESTLWHIETIKQCTVINP